MQLPLEVCHKYGQFAFQDKQEGVKAIAAIQYFIEEYHNGSIYANEPQAKVVAIKRDKAGVVVVAKTQKLLPNLVISIKDIAKNLEKLLDKSTDAVIIVGGFSSDNWLSNVGAGLGLIKFAIYLIIVELKQEYNAPSIAFP